MIELNDVLSEIMARMIDTIIHGGNTPQKIIVSEKVYDLLKGITLMPRSVQFIDNVFYIADIPVEAGKLDDPKGDIWFKIE